MLGKWPGLVLRVISSEIWRLAVRQERGLKVHEN